MTLLGAGVVATGLIMLGTEKSFDTTPLLLLLIVVA